MAIAPILNYTLPFTGLARVEEETQLIKIADKQVLALADGVTVEVFNVGGGRVAKCATGVMSLGKLAHGVYIVRATLGGKTQTMKVML